MSRAFGWNTLVAQQSEEPKDGPRLKKFALHYNLLAQWFQAANVMSAEVVDGLPPDAEVVNVYQDQWEPKCWVIVRHESFDRLKEAQPIPTMQITLRRSLQQGVPFEFRPQWHEEPTFRDGRPRDAYGNPLDRRVSGDQQRAWFQRIRRGSGITNESLRQMFATQSGRASLPRCGFCDYGAVHPSDSCVEHQYFFPLSRVQPHRTAGESDSLADRIHRGDSAVTLGGRRRRP